MANSNDIKEAQKRVTGAAVACRCDKWRDNDTRGAITPAKTEAVGRWSNGQGEIRVVRNGCRGWARRVMRVPVRDAGFRDERPWK